MSTLTVTVLITDLAKKRRMLERMYVPAAMIFPVKESVTNCVLKLQSELYL